MSHQISEETLLLFMSLYSGLVLILCYDAIRIFRRVFPAGLFRVILEDIIYWTCASIFMFNIFLKYNYGRPRFFVIILTLGTMVLFEFLFGKKLMNPIAGLLKKIVQIFSKPLKKAKQSIKLKKKKMISYVNQIKKKEKKHGKSNKKNACKPDGRTKREKRHKSKKKKHRNKEAERGKKTAYTE